LIYRQSEKKEFSFISAIHQSNQQLRFLVNQSKGICHPSHLKISPNLQLQIDITRLKSSRDSFPKCVLVPPTVRKYHVSKGLQMCLFIYHSYEIVIQARQATSTGRTRVFTGSSQSSLSLARPSLISTRYLHSLFRFRSRFYNQQKMIYTVTHFPSSSNHRTKKCIVRPGTGTDA